MHNVDRCRTPVLIYAGASPFTFEGELKGTRFDFAMTLQGKLSELLSFSASLRRPLLFLQTSQIRPQLCDNTCGTPVNSIAVRMSVRSLSEACRCMCYVNVGAHNMTDHASVRQASPEGQCMSGLVVR